MAPKRLQRVGDQGEKKKNEYDDDFEVFFDLFFFNLIFNLLLIFNFILIIFLFYNKYSK